MQDTILIDITTYCNLDCKFCYRGQENHHKIHEQLSIDDVKKIFDRNSEYLDVSLINKGEMFVHPDFMNIFKYIIKEAHFNKNIRSVFLFTNGTLFKKEYVDEIISYIEKYKVKFRVNFSLNAAKEKTYKELTGKDLMNVAYENCQYFILKAFEYNQKFEPTIEAIPQSLVLNENRDELLLFIQKWEDFFNNNNIPYEVCEDSCISDYDFVIALKRVYLGEDQDITLFYDVITELQKSKNIRINENIETGKDFFKRKACDFLFNQPVMNNEYVTTCCRDLYFNYKYKKVGEDESELERFYKQSHFLGEFENIKICEDCFNYKFLIDNDAKKYSKNLDIYRMYKKRLKTGFPFEFYFINCDSMSEQFCIDFLEKKDLFVLSGNIKTNNILNSVNKEIKSKNSTDFCACWKTHISFKDNKIFFGCEGQIECDIDDLDNYFKELSGDNYKRIPLRCIDCNKKIFFDELRDRLRIFGQNNFSSPVIRKKSYYDSIYNLKMALKEKDETKLSELIEKNNNVYFYRELLNNIIKFEFNSKTILDFFKKCNNLFIVQDYTLYCEDFFEEMVQRCLEIYSEDLSLIIKTKLIEYYLSERIKNDYLINRSRTIMNDINKDPKKFFNGNFELFDDFTVSVMKKIDSLENIEELKEFFNKYKNIILLYEVRKQLEFCLIRFIKEGFYNEIKFIINNVDIQSIIAKKEVNDELLNRIIQNELENAQSVLGLIKIIKVFSINFETLEINDIFFNVLYEVIKKDPIENIIIFFDFIIEQRSDYQYLNKLINREDLSVNIVKSILFERDIFDISKFFIRYPFFLEDTLSLKIIESYLMTYLNDNKLDDVYVFIKKILTKEANINFSEDFIKNVINLLLLDNISIELLTEDYSLFEYFFNKSLYSALNSYLVKECKKNPQKVFGFLEFNNLFTLLSSKKYYDICRMCSYEILSYKNLDDLFCKKICFILIDLIEENKNMISSDLDFINYLIKEFFIKIKSFLIQDIMIFKIKNTLSDLELLNYFFNEFRKKYMLFLREKRYFSLWKHIKLDDFIKDENSFLRKIILETGFRDYNFSFIKLLKLLEYYTKDDEYRFRIYSWYIDNNDFIRAKFYFEKIDYPENYWSDNDYVYTIEYLEDKTRKGIVNKVKQMIKGMIRG